MLDDEQLWQELAQLTDDGALQHLGAEHYPPSRATSSCCWGGLLQGDVERCRPAANTGAHFKDKLCESCRANGLLVPIQRLRALTPELHESYANRQSGGLWTNGEWRLINQTAKCLPPRLVVFRSAPPPSSAWAAVPADWIQNGYVRLVSRLGTLVPAAAALERLPDRRSLVLASTTSVSRAAGKAAPASEAAGGMTGELLAAHDFLESLICRHLSHPRWDREDGTPRDDVAEEQHTRLRAVLEPLRASAAVLRAGAPRRCEDGTEVVVEEAPMLLSSSVLSSSHSAPATLPPSPPPLSSIAEDGQEEGRAADVGQQLAHELGALLTLGDCAPEHTVGVGETLATIAMRHRLQTSQLRAWNGLLSDRVVVGQQLRLEAPDATALGITFSATPRDERRRVSSHQHGQLDRRAPSTPDAAQMRSSRPMWPMNAARTPFRPSFAADPKPTLVR